MLFVINLVVCCCLLSDVSFCCLLSFVAVRCGSPFFLFASVCSGCYSSLFVVLCVYFLWFVYSLRCLWFAVLRCYVLSFGVVRCRFLLFGVVCSCLFLFVIV